MPQLLVLDDDREIGNLVRRLGRMGGYEVSVAHDWVGFVKLLDTRPDLVVIDLVMPEMDGVEVLRWLAAREVAPMVGIMSGLESRTLKTAEALGRSRGLEIIGSLKKPFRIADFLSFIALPGVVNEKGAVPDREPVTVAALERAIDRREITVNFQPQVRFGSGELLGFEALARWRHPTRGAIPPDTFVRMAECHGLIEPLTDLVFDLSFSQLAAWNDMGLRTRVAVNVASQCLKSLAFPDRLCELAERRAVDPKDIIIEITESGVSDDPITALDVLLRLRLKGVALSIDDFGTGYSTMEQLASIPFGELKIDRTFVGRARRDDEARAIVESSVELGHKLGLSVVAEGVEQTDDWNGLEALGCDAAQGYFVAAPMAGEEVPLWTERWDGPTPG